MNKNQRELAALASIQYNLTDLENFCIAEETVEAPVGDGFIHNGIHNIHGDCSCSETPTGAPVYPLQDYIGISSESEKYDFIEEEIYTYLPDCYPIMEELLGNSEGSKKLLRYFLTNIFVTERFYASNPKALQYYEMSTDRGYVITGSRKHLTKINKVLNGYIKPIIPEPDFYDHLKADGTPKKIIGNRNDIHYVAGLKAISYTKGPLLENAKWKRSKHTETFRVPRYKKQFSVPAILSIDERVLKLIIRKKLIEEGNYSKDNLEMDTYTFLDRVDKTNTFTVCETNRVFGWWSHIERIYRSALLIDGKAAVEVDIKSCHPTLLYTLYGDRNTTEAKNYLTLIQSGKLYEFFMRESGITSRDDIKKIFMHFIGGAIEKNGKPVKEVFQKYFPKLLDAILQKRKGRHHHATLARELQIMEAAFIKPLCLKYPVYSMHDGIICTMDLVAIIQQELETIITKSIGITPRIEIDNKRKSFLEDYKAWAKQNK